MGIEDTVFVGKKVYKKLIDKRPILLYTNDGITSKALWKPIDTHHGWFTANDWYAIRVGESEFIEGTVNDIVRKFGKRNELLTPTDKEEI